MVATLRAVFNTDNMMAPIVRGIRMLGVWLATVAHFEQIADVILADTTVDCDISTPGLAIRLLVGDSCQNSVVARCRCRRNSCH